MRPLYFYSLRVILSSCSCIVSVILALMSLPPSRYCSIVSSYAFMPYAPYALYAYASLPLLPSSYL